jgi:hypothetical protein
MLEGVLATLRPADTPRTAVPNSIALNRPLNTRAARLLHAAAVTATAALLMACSRPPHEGPVERGFPRPHVAAAVLPPVPASPASDPSLPAASDVLGQPTGASFGSEAPTGASNTVSPVSPAVSAAAPTRP